MQVRDKGAALLIALLVAVTLMLETKLEKCLKGEKQ